MVDGGSREPDVSSELARWIVDYCSLYGFPVPIEALSRIPGETLDPERCARLRDVGIASTLVIYTWRPRGMNALAQECRLSDVEALNEVWSVLDRYSWDPLVADGFADYLVSVEMHDLAQRHRQHADWLRLRVPGRMGPTSILRAAFDPGSASAKPVADRGRGLLETAYGTD